MSIFSRRGKAEIFEQAVSEYERGIYLMCLRMMGNREDAQDCAQEALLSAYHAFDRFRGEAQIKTWLYRIAYHTCIDALRRRRGVVSLDAMRDNGFDVAERHMLQPESAAERSELRAQLMQALAHLPEDQRAVLILRDFQDTAYDEISRILDLPEGTVKSRLSRAREKVKNFLKNGEQNACECVQEDERRPK